MNITNQLDELSFAMESCFDKLDFAYALENVDIENDSSCLILESSIHILEPFALEGSTVSVPKTGFVEFVKRIIMAIWDGIKAIAKKIWGMLTSFWNWVTGKSKKIDASLDKTKADLEKTKADTVTVAKSMHGVENKVAEIIKINEETMNLIDVQMKAMFKMMNPDISDEELEKQLKEFNDEVKKYEGMTSDDILKKMEDDIKAIVEETATETVSKSNVISMVDKVKSENKKVAAEVEEDKRIMEKSSKDIDNTINTVLSKSKSMKDTPENRKTIKNKTKAINTMTSKINKTKTLKARATKLKVNTFGDLAKLLARSKEEKKDNK